MSSVFVEPQGRVRTRIVATLGPASQDPAMLRRLMEAGVDLFRLNFSHGTHESHAQVLADIRRVAAEMGRIVGVLQDLGGPKIRLGPITGDVVDCHEGEEFRLVKLPDNPNDPHELTCTYDAITDDLKPGETVFFADGVVAMRVKEVASGRATLEVTLPGRIRSKQGLNLPGTDLKVKALTEKDLSDLDWTASHEVDYVGLSFVRRAEDVEWLREELCQRGCFARIVSKIEKPQALEHLEEILDATDAVMVARGDLGVEIDLAMVPAVQKRVIAACHRSRVPVITATQMLASMETSNRPTRAEASDVFNAILDGTDAVMLSGETAIGQYPVEAVEMMSRIALQAEALLSEGPPPVVPPISPGRTGWVTPITESVVEAAALAARELKAGLLAVVTQSGRSALAIAFCRNAAPTIALTANEQVARWMTLYWGVTPLVVPKMNDHESPLRWAQNWAREHNLIQKGDRIVLMRGASPERGIHNAMLVDEVS
jgi:pyruvate kinase